MGIRIRTKKYHKQNVKLSLLLYFNPSFSETNTTNIFSINIFILFSFQSNKLIIPTNIQYLHIVIHLIMLFISHSQNITLPLLYSLAKYLCMKVSIINYIRIKVDYV